MAWIGYLYLLINVILSVLSGRSDNPTSIIPPLPYPDPGYIIAESSSGLANRLRVMAAYMYIAQSKYNGAHLVFIWDPNEACPGHFLSLFEPIPNVIFANNASRYVLDKHAKINYENSFAVFDWIMRMNHIPKNRNGHSSWSQICSNMHALYKPRREVMYKALTYIHTHRICQASAMHIRETDMALSISRKSGGRKKPSANIHSFMKFVESRPTEEPIFLLTDNPSTQKFFLEKYGSQKILVYSLMNNETAGENNLPWNVTNTHDIEHLLNRNDKSKGIVQVQSQQQHAEDHRYTTLENTLLDVLIAAHAKEFKASGFSSLSELVSLFSSIGRRERGWCQ